MKGKMMEYRGYHATVGFDAEDRIFIGEVFGIVDSLNFHGESVDELEEMFHQSIDNYLKMCKHYGKEPDKEFSGAFNVRIPPELHKKVALLAHEQGQTLNHVVKTAIEKMVCGDYKETTTIYVLDSRISGIHWAHTYNENEDFSQSESVISKYEKEVTLCPA